MKTTNLYELKKIKTDFEVKKITCSKDSSQFIRQFYGDDLEIYESFFILLLNRANETIGYAKISQGGIVGTVVDVKIICKYVIDSLSSGVIIAHNHPSGALKASKPDLDMTNKIKVALSYLDTSLLDSIILTKESYLSLADEGQM